MNESEIDNGIERKIVLQAGGDSEASKSAAGDHDSKVDLEQLYNPW